MIRFVEITGLFFDDTKSFGFFNTDTNHFISIWGSHAFDSVAEFEIACEADESNLDYKKLKSKITSEWELKT